MTPFKILAYLCAATATLLAMNPTAFAAEYFVTKRGNDTASGTSRETSWSTIQKGVATLQPGDILSIGPGEYFGAVKRADLGADDRETVIRAEIPGTVLLRGDVPAPAFRPVEGMPFVYSAPFDAPGDISAVNEIDTLTILRRMPNSAELPFVPGTFSYAAAARTLYIATSDMRPADTHRYTVSVVPTHGILLVKPRRVVLEGLATTGFSAMELLHYREQTAGGVWGIFLVNPKGCTIRDCRAYLNAWGIGLNSGEAGSGDNVIERCVAWGNKSAFANGDMGGITVFGARRDVIRESTAYRNGMYGINIYGTGGAPPNADDGGNDPKNLSRLVNNFGWGNETADLKIKTGYEYHHTIENSVGLGLWSATNINHGLIGRAAGKSLDSTSIVLGNETGVELPREFADPAHHDYRLQATSRFRGSNPGSQDRGPHPFTPNVFYVRNDGNDDADGLSIGNAWKTLSRATTALRGGATLYLEPGTYESAWQLAVQGTTAAPVSIRGRGEGRVVINGAVNLTGSAHVQFSRLHFRSKVIAVNAREVNFDQCEFSATDTALVGAGTEGLRISHCIFTRFQDAALDLKTCSRVDLSGNILDNAQGTALRLAAVNDLRHSNYNSYRRTSAAWSVAGKAHPWSAVREVQEPQSHEIAPEFSEIEGIPQLANAAPLIGLGPMGKPIGRFEDKPIRPNLRVTAPPVAFSVSATTANLEWTTSLPATCQLGWGETPACERETNFNVNCFGSFSLTGLKPGTTYYFRIKSIEVPKDMAAKVDAEVVAPPNEPISFKTLPQNSPPATYYVATDGDDRRSGSSRQEAWRTLRHAAGKANVGDTVLVAGGKYSERVRMRSTGEEGSPITFRALPGERVELNGDNSALPNAFVAGGKSHLRFDGFYFASFNLFPNDHWSLLNSGEFQLYCGRDIVISRCFSEGRGGYSAPPIYASEVEGLTVRNCVNTYKFGGMYFWRCPNLLIENTVFALPMIMSFVLRNEKDQEATMKNCIFTDMLEKKAKLNIGLLCCDGAMDSFRQQNNAYHLRCFPPEERALNGSKTIAQLGDFITDPVFADPLFAGDPGVRGNFNDKSGFAADRMMDSALKLDFDSFFSTNPELIRRDIGLQREAFQDFKFAR